MPHDDKAWNPYLAGGLTGLVSVLSVLVADKYLGASTTFVRAVGMLERALSPALVETAYYQKYTLGFDWQFLFVAGIGLGAFLASRSDGSFAWESVPPMWAERFGHGVAGRWLVAFAGGAVALFGARLAGGCPSGHGLSGLSQMAVSGYLAGLCFFVGGFVMARLVYGQAGKGGRR